MTSVVRRSWACPNVRCPHYRELRDGQGYCRSCGYITKLVQIITGRR